MATSRHPVRPRMTLVADTASQLMTTNPVSINATASIQEAVALMTDRGFSAAAAIDEAGRPVGVITRTDLLIHQREQVRHARLQDQSGWEAPARLREGFEVEVVDNSLVSDVMTPVVFTVALDTPAATVVEQMLALHVHHLFVVDRDGALVGIIAPHDILRRLKAE